MSRSAAWIEFFSAGARVLARRATAVYGSPPRPSYAPALPAVHEEPGPASPSATHGPAPDPHRSHAHADSAAPAQRPRFACAPRTLSKPKARSPRTAPPTPAASPCPQHEPLTTSVANHQCKHAPSVQLAIRMRSRKESSYIPTCCWLRLEEVTFTTSQVVKVLSGCSRC